MRRVRRRTGKLWIVGLVCAAIAVSVSACSKRALEIPGFGAARDLASAAGDLRDIGEDLARDDLGAGDQTDLGGDDSADADFATGDFLSADLTGQPVDLGSTPDLLVVVGAPTLARSSLLVLRPRGCDQRRLAGGIVS